VPELRGPGVKKERGPQKGKSEKPAREKKKHVGGGVVENTRNGGGHEEYKGLPSKVEVTVGCCLPHLWEGHVAYDKVPPRGEVALAPKGQGGVKKVGLGGDFVHEKKGGETREEGECHSCTPETAVLQNVQDGQRYHTEQSQLQGPLSDGDLPNEVHEI